MNEFRFEKEESERIENLNINFIKNKEKYFFKFNNIYIIITVNKNKEI